MIYKYNNHEFIFPGDIVVWYHPVSKFYYIGKIIFRIQTGFTSLACGFDGLYMEIYQIMSFHINGAEAGEKRLPKFVKITEGEIKLLKRERASFFYFSGEQILDGDFIAERCGESIRLAQIKMRYGKSEAEPWEDGSVLFIEMHNVSSGEIIEFAFIDTRDNSVSEKNAGYIFYLPKLTCIIINNNLNRRSTNLSKRTICDFVYGYAIIHVYVSAFLIESQASCSCIKSRARVDTSNVGSLQRV